MLRLSGVLIRGDGTAACMGDEQRWFAVSLRALRYVTGPAVTARRDLPCGGTRSRPLGPGGGGCGSGGAEVPGELVAESLVLGPQPGDLIAVGPYLLAQRAGGGPLRGAAAGRQRQAQNHRTVLINLDKIIASLQALHPTGADGNA